MPISETMRRALEYLDTREIRYELHRHVAVFTSEEADKHRGGFTGVACKNLFLRNKKATRHFLVTLPTTERFDLDAFASSVGEKHLSFGSPERLMEYLGVTPGSVSPMCLINDSEHRVEFFIHPVVISAPLVSMHPNDNTASLWLSHEEFVRFLDSTGHSRMILST
jgi:Ala-tRNA(Pro) deacylase